MDKKTYATLMQSELKSINLYANNNLVEGEGSFVTLEAKAIMESLSIITHYLSTGEKDNLPRARAILEPLMGGENE